MHMYVGNCTKQRHEFIYQVIGEARPRKIPIEVLGTVKLTTDLDPHQFKAIVEQHAIYGMRDVATIDQSREFVGLCYSDKPIKLQKIGQVIEFNDGQLMKRGDEIQKQAAAATAGQIQDAAEGRMNQFELSVTEEVGAGETPRINSGVRVMRSGEGPSDGASPKSRRNKKRGAG